MTNRNAWHDAVYASEVESVTDDEPRNPSKAASAPVDASEQKGAAPKLLPGYQLKALPHHHQHQQDHLSVTFSQPRRHSKLHLSASEPSLLGGSGGSRPGTGRFSLEELQCFRRLPTPSLLCSQKAELFGCGSCTLSSASSVCSSSVAAVAAPGPLPLSRPRQGSKSSTSAVGSDDHSFVMRSWVESTLEKPRSRESAPLLPLEDQTARILDEIYPRTSSATDANAIGRPLAHQKNKGQHVRRPSKEKDISLEDQRARGLAMLRVLRGLILARFSSVREAMEALTGACSMSRELTRKEFCRLLNKRFKDLNKDDQWAIFDYLVEERAGVVTLIQLHVGLEAAAPVKTVEDLRRRFIAIGFGSMKQVIARMSEEVYDTDTRLSQGRFGYLLSGVGVTTAEEQNSIFKSICDRHQPAPDGQPTTSLDELTSALASVSPMLLLEDLGERLSRKYSSLTTACEAAGFDKSISLNIFVARAEQAWKLSEADARVVFSFIDCEDRGFVDRRLILRALQLAAAGLFMEELRHRIRQRFLSIQRVLLGGDETIGIADDIVPSNGRRHSVLGNSKPTEDVLGTEYLMGMTETRRARRCSANDFSALLAAVQLPESDTRILFDLMDIDGDGKLTRDEFVTGINALAPACCLEALRLQILAMHNDVKVAFAHELQELKGVPLNSSSLHAILVDLDLAGGVDVDLLVSLLEPRPDAGLSVSALVAALQSCSPGCQVLPRPDESKARTRQAVKLELAPYQKTAKEFRMDVRKRPRPPDLGVEVQTANLPDVSVPVGGRRRGLAHSTAKGDPKGPVAVPLVAELRKDSPLSMSTPSLRASYAKVSDLVRTACAPSTFAPAAELETPMDPGPILERLQGYYSMASTTMAKDTTLLGQQHSRLHLFRSSNDHRRLLEKPIR